MHLNDFDLKVLYLDCEKCKENIDHKHPTKRGRKKQHPKIKGNEKYAKDIKHDYTTRHIQHPIGGGSMFKCTMNNCGFSTNFKKSLDRHHEIKHLNIVRFRCNICDYESYEISCVKFHQKTQHIHVTKKVAKKHNLT